MILQVRVKSLKGLYGNRLASKVGVVVGTVDLYCIDGDTMMIFEESKVNCHGSVASRNFAFMTVDDCRGVVNQCTYTHIYHGMYL